MLKALLLILIGGTLPVLAVESADTLTEDIRGKFTTPLNGGLNFHYAPFNIDKYDWGQGPAKWGQGKAFRVSMEWLPVKPPYGKLGLGVDTGYLSIRDLDIPGVGSGSLTGVVLGPYLSYRLDYFENQFLVPYGRVGVTWTHLTREISAPQLGNGRTEHRHSALGQTVNWAVGMELLLNIFERRAAKDLDASTGINGTYLTFEFARSEGRPTGQQPDLSNDEYRMGLRFEM